VHRPAAVQNVRVHAPRRPALSFAVVTVAAALVLAGCSSDSEARSDDESPSASSSASPSPSSTVEVPDEVDLTDQGTELSFGEPGVAVFEPTQGKGSVLQLTVRSVQKGTLADFKGFILDDAYKQNADYFYARVQVKNVGEGDVGGVGVPLWGVNSSNTLLPPVNFTTSFAKCPTQPLPASFPAGATLDTCLVYLSPDHGSLEAVSYRPSQEFNPITWTGDITTPKPTPTKKAKPKKKR
jgi:hypothetical protein